MPHVAAALRFLLRSGCRLALGLAARLGGPVPLWADPAAIPVRVESRRAPRRGRPS